VVAIREVAGEEFAVREVKRDSIRMLIKAISVFYSLC
jgi:hypothetical protein